MTNATKPSPPGPRSLSETGAAPMTDASPRHWTSENHRQGFDRFCRAILWRGERPAVIRPIYASTAREESASTKRKAEAAARLEWLDSIGALPEFPRTEDTQPDESVAERDRVWWDELALKSSGHELIQIIRATLDEVDERNTKTKLSFVSHMWKRCPWLKHELAWTVMSQQDTRPAGDDGDWIDMPDNALLSSREIAEKAGVPHDPLRKRLDRWRSKNKDQSGAGWFEVSDRKPKDPQFLYRFGTVRGIVSSERPAK